MILDSCILNVKARSQKRSKVIDLTDSQDSVLILFLFLSFQLQPINWVRVVFFIKIFKFTNLFIKTLVITSDNRDFKQTRKGGQMTAFTLLFD